MYATKIFDAKFIKSCYHNASVFLVISNVFTTLSNTFFTEYSFCTTLDNVGNAVEFSGLTTKPHFVKVHFFAGSSFAYQSVGHNGVTATSTGKACSFGQGAQLDGTFFSAFHTEDAARNGRVRNESFVSSIIKNYCIIFASISNPSFQLFFGVSSTSRIVRRAQVHNISFYVIVRHRQEVVFRSALHIDNLTTTHNVGIQVNRINRIRNQDGISVIKNVGDVTAVTLCTVTNKNFVACQFNAKRSVIFNQSFVQEIVALFRAVATESSLHAHFFNCFFHSFYNASSKRKSYVTNAQANNFFVRISSSKSIYFACDVCKKISFFQVSIVLIN